MAVRDKKYFWLKLKRDFFKRHDIRIIESMPNGKEYILFYLKLLCESVDHDGNLRFSDQIPYSEDMLATITDTNVDIVRSAIKIFTELGMMEMFDDGTLFMNEVNKMLGSETYWAERKRIQKAREINGGFENFRVLSNEQIGLPNGETRFIDEKRYGGNGKSVLERANCKCEICGSSDNLCIHHMNGFSNDIDDLILVCRSCHRKIETGEIDVGKIPMKSNDCPACPSKSKRQSKSQSKKEKKTFSPPSLEDVRSYCKERCNHVDPESFIDFYKSKGWMIGKNKMKDWKASVRTWERKEKQTAKSFNNHPARDVDMDELEKVLLETN